MGIKESRFGDPISRENKRFKIRGILRDCLREKSVGCVQEMPERKIKIYAKPVGVIACVIPATNPDLTPAGNARLDMLSSSPPIPVQQPPATRPAL